MFETDKGGFYRQRDSEEESNEDKKPNAEKDRKFWSNICDKPINHNTDAKKVREVVISEMQRDLKLISV